jgi:hypothetical protein
MNKLQEFLDFDIMNFIGWVAETKFIVSLNIIYLNYKNRFCYEK